MLGGRTGEINVAKRMEAAEPEVFRMEMKSCRPPRAASTATRDDSGGRGSCDAVRLHPADGATFTANHLGNTPGVGHLEKKLHLAWTHW